MEYLLLSIEDDIFRLPDAASYAALFGSIRVVDYRKKLAIILGEAHIEKATTVIENIISTKIDEWFLSGKLPFGDSQVVGVNYPDKAFLKVVELEFSWDLSYVVPLSSVLKDKLKAGHWQEFYHTDFGNCLIIGERNGNNSLSSSNP